MVDNVGVRVIVTGPRDKPVLLAGQGTPMSASQLVAQRHLS